MILDSKPNKQQYSMGYSEIFQERLADVAKQLQIGKDWEMSYGDFEPITIDDSLQQHIAAMPESDRDLYLAAKLQKYLYEIFSTDAAPDDVNDEVASDSEDEGMANSVRKWSRTKFCQELKASNHGVGYSDPGWLIGDKVGDRWNASKNGLTLHIKPRHLANPDTPLKSGEYVALQMPANEVDRGFYIAVSDRGSVKPSLANGKSAILQIYFNITASGALSLLNCFSQEFNKLGVAYSFSLAYNEADFNRIDAAILEVWDEDFVAISSVIKEVYQKETSSFASEIPFFCLQLLPGIGLAQKPLQPKFKRENIGQHYCGIIAQALIASHQAKLSPTDRYPYLLKHLQRVGVNLDKIYLNLGFSTDYSW